MVGANGLVNQTAPGPGGGIKKEPGVNTGDLLSTIILRQTQNTGTGLDPDLTPDDEDVMEDDNDDGEEPENIKQEDLLMNDLFPDPLEGQMDVVSESESGPAPDLSLIHI